MSYYSTVSMRDGYDRVELHKYLRSTGLSYELDYSTQGLTKLTINELSLNEALPYYKVISEILGINLRVVDGELYNNLWVPLNAQS